MRRLALLCCLTALAAAQDATLKKVCGTCHPLTRVTTERHTRQQWQESIDKMVTLGAKATPDEFSKVLDVLTKDYGLDVSTRVTVAMPPQRDRPGANDKHVVDKAAADRGAKVWAVKCLECHGPDSRGTSKGPNLVRSEMVMHDRYGSELTPFLKKGHPEVNPAASAKLEPGQMVDLSHFLHQRLYDTLRGSPIFHEGSILTGDAKAGEAFFNGEGRCNTCHSVTGDLAKIGAKYEPTGLQHRFLNPRPGGGRGPGAGNMSSSAKRMTLTVTTASGESFTGVPVLFDDFNVALRDASGEYRSFKRTPGLKVVRNDPYAVHDELMEKYTDKNMHDIVAYLVTLK